MSSIIISVIIPIYNVERYIEKTLESLKSQKFTNIEYILINDGSTDGTEKKILAETALDDRFLIVTTENRGVSAARNIGLDLSKGDYVLFLDADDYYCDDAISKLYKAAIETEADITYGRIKRFDNTKSWYVKSHIDSGMHHIGEKNILDNPELFYSIGPGAKLFSKKIIKSVKFPENISYGEDQILTVTAYLNARKVVCIDEDVYMYRIRESKDSSTQTLRENCLVYLEGLLEVTKINLTYIQTSENYNESQKQFIMKSYFERLLKFEVYPNIKAGLRKRKYRKKVIDFAKRWLLIIPKEVKNMMSGIVEFLLIDLNMYVFTFNIIESTHLKKLTFEINLVDRECLNDDQNNLFESNTKYRLEFIDSTRITHFFKRFKSLLSYFYKKNYIGNKISATIFYASKALPINNKLVVVAKSKKIKNNDSILYITEKIEFDETIQVKYVDNFNNSLTEDWKKFFLLSTAKIIVVDDYFYPLYSKKIKKNQYYIQLWHAAGAYKKFGYSSLDRIDSNDIEFEKKAHQQYTHIIASSKRVGDIYSEAFNQPRNKVYDIGFPRTDMLKNLEDKDKLRKNFFEIYPNFSDKKIILYAPTFRGSLTERVKFRSEINWSKIKLPDNVVLLTKYHPIVSDIPKVNHTQITNIDSTNQFSILELLVIIDVLITDYSSLIFEYSLLDKPLINFFSDYESYSKERGLYYPIETYSYDLVAKNETELTEMIEKAIDPERQMKSREHFITEFMSACDGSAGDRFQKLINSLVR